MREQWAQCYVTGHLGNERIHGEDGEINGETLMMEIDTRAAVPIISEDTYRKKFPKLKLAESALRLATYTTQRIQGLGKGQAGRAGKAL